MKKFLSAVVAVVMTVASFSVVANAATANYKLTVTPEIWELDEDLYEVDVITEANAGDSIAIYLDFSTGGKGFAAYGVDIAFDTKVFSLIDTDPWGPNRTGLPMPNIGKSNTGISIASGKDSNISEKNPAAVYIPLQIAEDAVTGTYTFTLSDILDANGNTNNVNANLEYLEAEYGTITLKVNGTDPVPDTVPATATFDEEKQEGTVYGLKGSIAANDQTVTGVAFKVNNGEKDGNVNATFTQAIAKNSNVTFGVNITGIPSGITLGYVADSLAPVAE